MSMNRDRARITQILTLLLGLIIWTTPCHAGRLDDVRRQFQDFSREWTARIQNAYIYTRNAPQIIEEKGGFTARFFYMDPTTISLDVKASEEDKDVFTGVLRYNEYVYESRADTREAAEDGYYTAASQREMIEIFLYRDGHWHH